VLVGAVVAAAAAVAVVLLLNRSSHTPPPPAPTVPSVTGLSKLDAVARIDAAGYVALPELVNSHRRPGTVTGVSPPAGTQLSKGSTVVLDISSGPKVTSVQIPDVDGERLPTAIHKLHLAGFTVSPMRESSTTVKKNLVISMSPGPGTPLVKGSTVVLFYSSGPPKVAVPGVVGETLGQARPVLQARGFNVAVLPRTTGSSPAGTVLMQSPPAGKAPEGSTVTLTVAKAPPNVTVPYVIGLTLTQADTALTKLGLVPLPVLVVRHVNEAYNGRVISQVPTPASSEPPRTQVTIRVEQYEAPVGPTGPTGSSGPSGGASGPSGPSGVASGPSGGASGPSGGASGPSGGASGPSGGASGPSGITGTT
jgi:serine/threonine-protein kinase